MLPLLKPKQDTFTVLTPSDKALAGWVMVAETLWVQPIESMIVTEYIPACTFEISSVVEPFDHEKVYGGTPPDGVKLILPVLVPKQLMFNGTAEAVIAEGGCVMVAVTKELHSLASVMNPE